MDRSPGIDIRATDTINKMFLCPTWSAHIPFPLPHLIYLQLEVLFSFFDVSFYHVNIVLVPVILFKIYVLKPTPSVKSIPGLEPHCCKNLTQRLCEKE